MAQKIVYRFKENKPPCTKTDDQKECPPRKFKVSSPFVSKLRLLVFNPKLKDAIRWTLDGKAIVIPNEETFKSCILNNETNMFKTKNFTSFVRQLNLYGFRKMPWGKNQPARNLTFEHLYFRRDRPDLMHLVHRTCMTKKQKNHEVTKENEGHFQILDENDDLLDFDPPLKCLEQLVRNQQDGETDDSVSSTLANVISDPLLLETSSDSSLFDEHDYALPSSLLTYPRNTFDEKSTYQFLHETFMNEKEAIQTLLSLKSVKPLMTDYDALRTLAEVSSSIGNIPD